MQEIIIMQGLPRSGKSTFTKQYENNPKWKIIELDAIRLNYSEVGYDQDYEPLVFKDAYDTAMDYLMQGKNIIIDESNPSLKLIRFWTRIYDFNPVSYKVKIVRINTPLEECIRRTDDYLLQCAIVRKYNKLTKLDALKRFCKLEEFGLEIWENDKMIESNGRM